MEKSKFYNLLQKSGVPSSNFLTVSQIKQVTGFSRTSIRDTVKEESIPIFQDGDGAKIWVDTDIYADYFDVKYGEKVWE
jgi:hypothetical protein